MPFPPVEEFVGLLNTRPPDELVRDHVFSGLPYVFRARPRTADVLYEYLSTQLHVPVQNVRIVGSAKMGFSLSPDTFPRRFNPTSDIDVIVVDEKLFDTIWFALLKWHYPRRIVGLPGADSHWARERRKDIYWGWFFPSKIRFEGLSFPDSLKPIRDFSARWFNTFQSLAQFPEFATRTVSGRLYRTWDHARTYHSDGLRQIKEIAARGL